MRRRFILALLLTAILVIGLGGGSAAYAQQMGGQDARSFAATLAQLRTDRTAAAGDGYTGTDLQSVDRAIAEVAGASPPADPWREAVFYRAQINHLATIRAELGTSEETARAGAASMFRDRLGEAGAALQKDAGVGVPADEISEYQAALAQLSESTDVPIGVLRTRITRLTGLTREIGAAGDEQQQENTAIQQAAGTLQQEALNDPASLRKDAGAALAAGRNDATVAAYEDRAHRFPAMPEMNAAYDRLEHFGSLLAATDPAVLADAAAGTEHYAAKIHGLLLQNLGPQHIIVSFTDQRVWVYQGSQLQMTSLVTTGIRGVTDYGTDFGPMKVLAERHPFKFHSPYPPGSRYWYPDTWVQWTVFFTDSGESFHDAYWESDYELGPGSQFNPSTRSHGCIHLPYSRAEWLFNWAQIGTPVDVFPGDGTTVANQLAQMTTDDQGNPLNPA